MFQDPLQRSPHVYVDVWVPVHIRVRVCDYEQFPLFKYPKKHEDRFSSRYFI